MMLSNRKPFSLCLPLPPPSTSSPGWSSPLSLSHSKRRNGDVPNGNFSLSLSLSFSLSFVFSEFEQASEGCRQIGAESCHFKPFLQAYLKGLRGPCILGTTASASKQPPSASESTCGLLIRDPAVKFMQRTFNYDTDPLCEQWQWSGGGRGRRAGRHYGRVVGVRIAGCEL